MAGRCCDCLAGGIDAQALPGDQFCQLHANGRHANEHMVSSTAHGPAHVPVVRESVGLHPTHPTSDSASQYDASAGLAQPMEGLTFSDEASQGQPTPMDVIYMQPVHN